MVMKHAINYIPHQVISLARSVRVNHNSSAQKRFINAHITHAVDSPRQKFPSREKWITQLCLGSGRPSGANVLNLT
jgi:hypothetical protein